MRIAILGDIHDNFHNLFLALKEIKERRIDYILCLGDFGNCGIVKSLAYCGIPVYAIWGNNDGEVFRMTEISLSEGSKMKLARTVYGEIELDGKRIFLSHYPDLAKPIAASGAYDVVCYGHDHKKFLEKEKECVVVNPGEISAHKTGVASYAIYDSESGDVEMIDLEGSVSVKTELVDRLKKEYFSP